MDTIMSSNAYLKIPSDSRKKDENENENEEKDEEVPASEDVNVDEERKRKLPHWTRLTTDDERSEYADWTLDVTLINNNYGDDDDASDGDDDDSSDDDDDDDDDDNDDDKVDDNGDDNDNGDYNDKDNDDDNEDNAGDVVVSYLVHKCLLGGQSDYFKGIFRNPEEGGFAESHQKRSAIKLDTPAVTILHFENLLDYLYTGKVVVDSKNAVTMVYFGDYFGINLLQDQAQSFIRELISTEINSSATISRLMKVYQIYLDAKRFAMEDLQEAIVYTCAGNPRLILKYKFVVNKQFWCRVLAARKFHSQTDISNSLWSINVANFIKQHYSDIVHDRERFNELTQKDALPIISYKVAIFLMEQEHRMCAVNKGKVEKIDVKNLRFTCLQHRCIDALFDSENEQWKILDPLKRLEGRLQNLPPSVVELLMSYAINGEKKPRKCLNSIRISGAGNKFVNGVYIKTGLHQGYPMFTRSDTYKGKNESFCIYRHDDVFSYISTVPLGSMPGSDDCVYFYEKRTGDEEELFTVDKSWKPVVEGEPPSPNLQFVDA